MKRAATLLASLLTASGCSDQWNKLEADYCTHVDAGFCGPISHIAVFAGNVSPSQVVLHQLVLADAIYAGGTVSGVLDSTSESAVGAGLDFQMDLSVLFRVDLP